MTLRWRLGVYLCLLHLALFGFTLVFLRQHVALFLGVEVLLIASLVVGFRLIGGAMQPLDYTARFRDLLQEEDYAARLGEPAVRELDELVKLFNTMLGTLYRERLALGEQRGFLDSLLEATPSAVIVFDFDGAISLMNASAHALLQLPAPQDEPLRLASFAGLAGQLDALPLGESALLTDSEGRRYRAQRGRFFDRGFARHFVLVDELTDELESSERATYEKLIRVLPTRSITPSRPPARCSTRCCSISRN